MVMRHLQIIYSRSLCLNSTFPIFKCVISSFEISISNFEIGPLWFELSSANRNSNFEMAFCVLKIVHFHLKMVPFLFENDVIFL